MISQIWLFFPWEHMNSYAPGYDPFSCRCRIVLRDKLTSHRVGTYERKTNTKNLLEDSHCHIHRCVLNCWFISGNLFSEAESIAHRSSNLQARIDRIAVRVTQLDSTVEEGELFLFIWENGSSRVSWLAPILILPIPYKTFENRC